MVSKPEISKSRLVIGGGILVVGFLSPLLIPLVTKTDLSVGVKTTISGLLAFGIPELFMLIAIAVMGKQGYEFLKGKVLKKLAKYAPPDSVSLTRYRIGLILFTLPLLVGWVQPYLGHYFSFFRDSQLWPYLIGDAMFLASFFVLGGDFWDKFSGLFNRKAKISKADE